MISVITGTSVGIQSRCFQKKNPELQVEVDVTVDKSLADSPTLLIQHLLLHPTGNPTYMFHKMLASI
jgi:hypothetical protein